MDFFQFRTDYAHAKRLNLLNWSDESPHEYYKSITGALVHKLAECERKGLPYSRPDIELMNRSQALWTWEDDGKPYIKLFPAVTEMLATTKIDIDCQHVKFPFQSFEVRFPMSHNPMVEDTQWPLRSMLVSSIQTVEGQFGQQMLGLQPAKISTQRQVVLWLDFGETHSTMGIKGEPVFFFLNLHLVDGKSVQDVLNDAHERGIEAPGYVPSPAFCRSATAIAIAMTFFLNNQHELVAPDIHRRFIDRWHKAKKRGDKKELKTVLAQSKKLGHGGWTVGEEIELPRPQVVHHDKPTTEGHSVSGWELHFSHIRSGHMRLQWMGTGENRHAELIFIRPTVVRPDLPPRRGFVIKG